MYAAATGGRHTLTGFLKATSALGGTLPLGQGRSLGGLFNLSGLPPSELVGSYGGVGGILLLTGLWIILNARNDLETTASYIFVTIAMAAAIGLGSAAWLAITRRKQKRGFQNPS